MRKFSLISITAILLLTVAGCGGKKADVQEMELEKTKVVDCLTIEKQTDQITMSLMGIVEPNQTASLMFNSNGKIINLNVKKGDYVQKGQILGTLDTKLSASESTLVQKQMEEANASKLKLLQGADLEDIEQQKLKIEDAKRNLDKATQDLHIGEQLLANGAISKNEVEQLKIQAKQFENTLKTEELALNTLLKGPDQNQIASANLSIAQAQKETTRVSQDLEGKTLKAPFSGVVMDVKKIEGDITTMGTPVVELVDLSKVKIHVQVGEDSIDQFQLNNKVNIATENTNELSGIISYISPITDSATGKYKVEITVPLEKKEWKEGLVVIVEIPRKLTTGIVVPLQSVGISEKGNYVLLVENDIVKKQQVELGQTYDDKVEILSGINAGQKLITSGISYLLEGEKVEMKEATSGQDH